MIYCDLVMIFFYIMPVLINCTILSYAVTFVYRDKVDTFEVAVKR